MASTISTTASRASRDARRPAPASGRSTARTRARSRRGLADHATGPTPTFEISGPPGAPLVIALGGISADHHVLATDGDPSPGWWEAVAGPGRAIDTMRYRVLGIDFLDGGRGGDGRPLRAVSTHDQADAIARVLDAIGETRAHAIVGASYGGMVALAFAERYPERVRKLVVISAAHESHALSTALRVMQRRIVELGLDTGRPAQALALARGVAMTTYRSAREFRERFTPAPGNPDSAAPGGEHDDDMTSASDAVLSEVAGYLAHCGEQFAATFPIERFLALSLSADLHRVDPARIRTPVVLVAAEGDRLVPEAQLVELAGRCPAPSWLLHLATRHGHDAFLTEPVKLGRIIASALQDAPAAEARA